MGRAGRPGQPGGRRPQVRRLVPARRHAQGGPDRQPLGRRGPGARGHPPGRPGRPRGATAHPVAQGKKRAPAPSGGAKTARGAAEGIVRRFFHSCCASRGRRGGCEQDRPIDGRSCPGRRSPCYVGLACAPLAFRGIVEPMDHTNLIRRPRLRGPVLLAAFDGWNDAGEAATSALDAVADGLEAETFAIIDPEEFYDFQATRPTVRMVEGRRRIEWPQVELRAARLPAADHDLIVVRGHEPNLRWRTFADEIVELATDLRVEMVVTVGALLADVPHTRPVQVVSSAGDRDLAERLGLNLSRYEGPTGILGVLGDAATREGIPTIGLWAALPHYLNLAPNPWGAMALIQELGRLLPLAVDTSALAGQTEAFDAAVTELIDDNPELAGYIERLEADSDHEDDEAGEDDGSPGLADLPPEELVAEVERYLRDHPGK